MSQFESLMVELAVAADEFTRALDEGREAADRFAVALWRLLPWWGKVSHFLRHPVGAVRIIRAALKGGNEKSPLPE